MSESHISTRPVAVLLLERAEPRLLLSADPVTSVLSVAMDYADDMDSDNGVDLDQLVITNFPENSPADQSPLTEVDYPQSLSPDIGLADPLGGLGEITTVSELIIVDSRVADAGTLLESISPTTQNALTIFINPDHDGVENITAALNGYSGIQTIHLISHGDDGALQLGNSTLNSDTLSQYSDQLSLWQESLTDSADILIYGCNVAQSAAGEAFVQALASLTSADIAASDDLTGDASLSGDWQLEYQVGQVDATTPLSVGPAGWSGTLATNAFWFSTDGDVDLDNGFQALTWNDAEIVNFLPVPIPQTTIGGFGSSSGGILETTGFDIENFSNNTNIDALHHVARDISIGTETPIDLQTGDILLSITNDQTLTDSNLNSLDVDKGDIVIFRPDSLDDYSAGTFSLLFSHPSDKDITGISLVEETTIVGDTSLPAGSFLFTVQGDGSNDQGIHLFTPGDLTSGATNGTVTTLIDGTEKNAAGDELFKDKLVGIELVENDYTIGTVDLTAGTILITLSGNNGVAADNVELGERQDIFALNVSQTTLVSGSTAATVSLFFDGSDLGLVENKESLDAISFYAAQGSTNAEPEGGVSISGTAVEDQVLMADVSALSDADGLGAFSYQWQRDGVTIAGATGSQYRLDDVDVGAVINVVVSYMDGGDTHEVVISTATAVVGAVNDSISGLPQVNGNPQEGQVLTANTSGISDDDGLSAGFDYQWQRSADGTNWNDIGTATGVSYTLGNSDVGQLIRVVVSITDDQGFAEGPLLSSAVGTVSGTDDGISGQPEINGTAEEDQTLSVDTSSISDPDGLNNNSFTYQWQRSTDGVNWSDLSGATHATYTLDDADVGHYLRVAVSITDDQGFAEGPLISSATDAISAVNDPIVGLPLISGSAEEDQTLTADTSGISDVDGLNNSFTYQWQRSTDGVNWSDLTGATAETYTLDDADVGQYLRVAVSITDDQGFAEGPLVSSATTAISAVNDPIVGLPLISGSAAEDQTLTADTSGISDVDGLSNSFSYQWQRSTDGVNWSDLSGATHATYTLGDADVSQYLRVAVSITDDQGFAEGPLVSSATAAISAVNDPIVGSPLISGSAAEDQALTADTSGISDVDGLSNNFSYQWQRSVDGVNWSDLTGATAETYTLDDADVGQYLRVAVSITDDQGFAEGPLISSATAAISAVNDPIVGLPLISGSAAEDQTLTADTSGISDVDGLSNSFSYQWQRSTDGVNWSDLTGATAETYTLDDADVGQYLRVAVSITDDQGFAEGPLVSSATAAISAVNDPIIGLPLISGSAAEDQILSADTSGISDVDGLSNSFSYQWQRSTDGVNWSDLTGATAETYTLDDADVGQYLRVVVSITDDQNFDEGPLISSATAAISAVNDPIVGLPLISGSAAEDQTLSADTSGISDVDGLNNSFTYQWQRSVDGINWNDLTGATDVTYTLDDADVGQYLRVAVSITDDQGFAEGPLISSATDAISAVNDPIVGLPLISGSAAEDQILTADTSGISDVDGLSNSFTYQWQRSADGVNWSNLSGATNATYTLDDTDVGQYLRVVVSITDDQGFAEGPLVSSATAAISAVNDPIIGLPLISGSAAEDQTLSADTSGISDVDGLSNSFIYQWQRSTDGVNWSDLSGATHATYTLDDADVGHYLRVAVSITDDQGFAEGPLISSATDAISAVNDPIVGLPLISGSAAEDQILTADTSGISDVDGLSNSFTYQWQRSTDGVNWSDLSGATDVTYTLDDADVGQYLRVAVSITDDQGFAEGPLISSATAAISAVNDPIVGSPLISGSAEEDQTLTADTSGISDVDGLSNSFSYQWQRSADGVNWSDLTGATAETYTLDDADVGQYLRVVVSITDDQGFDEGPLVSSATAAISAVNDPIIGLPLISGSAEEDQVLTADTSGISDVDGLSNSFTYQWQRSVDGVSWSDLTGATAETYTLDDADVGQYLRVALSITDDQGFDEGPLVSSATAAISAVNDPIVGLPLISGSAEEDQTLTADTSGISDVDGLSNSFSYQWQRSTDGVNWSDLTGATAETYTLDDADVGQYLRVAVSITDDQGFAEGPLVSSATAAISAVNDPIIGLPLISGSAAEDQILSADTSGISDVDGLSNSFSYQWQRSTDGVNWSDLTGATAETYTLDDADVGQYLRVVVSITDDQNFDEGPLISSATAAISAVNDPIVGLPLISGSAAEDQTLSADTSGISDVDGLNNSFTYQWQRSVDGINWNDLTGATDVTYTLDDADVGQYLRVAVSITDDQGFAEGPLISSATDAISAVNDPIVGLPLISGSAAEDQILTADTSGISDVDGLSNSFTYQWQRSADGVNWSNLSGATNATYTLDDTDVGQYLRVVVSITDDQGFAEGPLVSSATAAISAVNDPIIGLPLISGSAAEDQALTADTSGISDVDGLSNNFSYQWQRSTDGVNWSDLTEATAETYTLDDADVGQYLRVAVSITDDQGFAEGPLVSSATDAISAVNDPIVGLPLISGSAAEDQILTADTSGISDVDGLSNSFTYQWQRSADGVNWSNLSGATNATYTLDDTDVGQYLRVVVSITDDQGFAEGPLVSSATAAISAVNDPIIGLPLISGSAAEDQTLTADTSGISDVDGLSNSFSYQWQRSADGVSWSDLSSATNATYTLDDADVGQYLRVAVSITDDQGFAEGPLISSATAAISAVNDPIIGLPLISGSAEEDRTLTADTSGISDVDGLSNSFTYQWQRSVDGINWNDLTGATDVTYTLDDADVGQYLRVAVSITDDQGFAEGPLVSSATDAISAVNDPIIGLPLISGSAEEDQTLTADTSGISDVDGLSNSFSYQWQRSTDGVNWSDLTGATAETYTLDDADVGQYLRVALSITDDQGFAEGPLVSSATAAISAVNDPIIGLPLISGSAEEDQILSADTRGIRDVDGLSNSFSYQWQRSVDGINWNDLTGATDVTYTLDDADVGQYLRVALSITDDQGFAEGPLISSATDAVSPFNHEHTGSLTISGNVAVGERLMLDNTLADPDGISAIAYQWYRSGVVINGATEQSYVLTAADAGKEIYVIARYVDLLGRAESVTSNQVFLSVPEVESVVVAIPEAELEESEEAPDVASGPADSINTPEPVVVVMESDKVITVYETPQFIIDTADHVKEQLGANKLNKAIAQEINTLRFQSVLDTMAQPLTLHKFDQFMAGIDQLQDEADQQHALNTMMVGGSIALSSGLSVGYVIWLARSGVLLSTVLTSLPAWRFIDPLPILSKTSTNESNAVGAGQDEETLGSMVEGNDESSDGSDDESKDDDDEADKEGQP